MASHTGGVRTAVAVRDRGPVSGRIAFAAVMMIFSGTMTLLTGVAALRKDQVFVSTRNYVFQFDLSGWGWVHLFVGIAIVLAGITLFNGAMWARIFGVLVAGLGLISNFLWLPYFPLWAVALLALDAFIIWALCTGARRPDAR